MEKEKVINEGGINGSAEGTIDYHSADFLALQAMIKASAEKLDETEKLNNTLLSIRFQMETYVREGGDKMVLAGEFIERFLMAIKVKKKDFAAYIEYDEPNLSALLKGRRKINSDLAIKLGRIFKVNPAIWLNIESKNELLKVVREQEEGYGKYSLEALLLKAG